VAQAYVKGQALEKLICEVIFQGVLTNLPASFYLGLGSGSLPLKADTLAAVAAKEVSGGGYARLQLTRNTTDFPTLALAAGDWKVTSAVKTWTAAADWVGNCDFAFLCDAASGSTGRFFGAVAIAEPFHQLADDTFGASYEYQDK
jgi:hypothetical protein